MFKNCVLRLLKFNLTALICLFFQTLYITRMFLRHNTETPNKKSSSVRCLTEVRSVWFKIVILLTFLWHNQVSSFPSKKKIQFYQLNINRHNGIDNISSIIIHCEFAESHKIIQTAAKGTKTIFWTTLAEFFKITFLSPLFALQEGWRSNWLQRLHFPQVCDRAKWLLVKLYWNRRKRPHHRLIHPGRIGL